MASMPSSPAASRSGVRTATPARWPAARGSQWALAQRPLPSMMIATCRGTFSRSMGVRISSRAFGGEGPVIRFRAGFSRALYLEELGFLIREGGVDTFDVRIGKLLELGLRPPLVVL